jgi:chromosomal replication initiation ATPase DnaA
MGPDPRQLALTLPVTPRFSAEDFLVGPSNEAAFAMIEAWPDWPDRVLRLLGPSGSGKSHLAAIWSERSRAFTLDSQSLCEADLVCLDAQSAVVLEFCSAAVLDEAALFHLLNRVRETGAFLLLVMEKPVESLGLRTKDLVSRLRLAPACHLAPPDDSLLKAVLVKLFLDRQLLVDTSIIDVLALHVGRSFAEARSIVAAIDAESLSRGKRVTRAIALEIVRRYAEPLSLLQEEAAIEPHAIKWLPVDGRQCDKTRF